MTILSFGAGQDSTAILYLLLFSEEFRARYVQGELIVVMADTQNEHPGTVEHTKKTILLCMKHKIPFFFITGHMGYTSPSWSKGLVEFWKLKNAIGSKAFPKTCTDKLKLTPIYNWLDDYISQKYGYKGGRKQAIVQYAKDHGKIQMLLGIAAGEEKRASTDDQSPFAWMRSSVSKIYPLIEIGWDRQACQDYIQKTLQMPLPPPSNCMFCPFLSKQELLWLYRHYPERYYEWVELEANKIAAHSHLDPKKNMGVWGNKLLPEVLKEAEKEFGHMTTEELNDYKMSHGHCVASKY